MPRLIATFSFRYDKDLCFDLLRNLDFIDGFVCIDDTDRKGLWCHEGERKALLRKMAKDKGADWIIHCSPDERYEKRAGPIIRDIVDNADPTELTCYGCRLREMYTPTMYRVDGIWKMKQQYRLLPLNDAFEWGDASIQQSMMPLNGTRQLLDINLYHFKHIDPRAGKIRAAVFSALDPDQTRQKVGYDYLAQERYMELAKIPENHEYEPIFDGDYRFDFPKELTKLVK